jgi:hypothetical protein
MRAILRTAFGGPEVAGKLELEAIDFNLHATIEETGGRSALRPGVVGS